MYIEQKIYELAGITAPEEKLLRKIKTDMGSGNNRKKVASVLGAELPSDNSVVAVRTVDILSLIPSLLQGKIPVDYGRPEDAAISKPEGWFFTTPTAEFYQLHPEIQKPADLPDTLEETVSLNNNVYRSLVFNVGFHRNIVPLLKPDWKDKVDGVVSEYDDFAGERFPAKFEIFLELLTYAITGENPYEIEADNKLLKRTRSEFANMLRPRIGQPAIAERFLQQAHQERRGAVVCFNEKVLQGELATLQTKEGIGVVGSDLELVIKPKNGTIDLDPKPITTILPMGKFEQDILGKIGV